MRLERRIGKVNTPLVGGTPLRSAHWSGENGVHVDLGDAPDKLHIPLDGQTTLQTFRIGGLPGYDNDQRLAGLGVTMRPPPIDPRRL